MSEVLGLLFAIIVGLTFVPKLAELSQKANDNTRAVTTAQQQKKLIEASTAYIQQYSSTLQSTATATTPVIITVPMLTTVNLLDASFAPTNPYGQTWQTAVLQPSAGQLQALAMSYGGTTALTDMAASKIAGLVGAQGGFIPKNDSGVYAAGSAYGAFSGWKISTANYPSVAGGRLASLLTFNNGQLNNNYLYRNAVPGNPGVNTMNTPLLMGPGATVTLNAACTSVGAIARDASGKMMSCQGGQWKGSSTGGLTWKGTVANVGGLPTSGNAAGDTYRVSGLSNHAFTWDSNSSVWQGLVVDQSGSLVLPGVIYASGSNSNYGAITILGQTGGWSGINFKDSWGGNLGTLMMNATDSGFFNNTDNAWRWHVDNNGTSDQAGRAQAGSLLAKNKAWEGDWCGTEGEIIQSANTSGLLLSCQSSTWKKQGASGTAKTTNESTTTGVSYHYGNGQLGSVYCPNNKVLVGFVRTDVDDMFHFICRNIEF